MTRLQSLTDEFALETAVARRHLERIPEDRLDWRPHPKSFAVGDLGGHLAECVRWAEHVFSADGLDVDPAAYVSLRPDSHDDLLDTFDARVEAALGAMRQWDDRDADGPWRMRLRGETLFEKPREAAFRDLSLSHLVHHRGQLTVYLRLLDVPLVGTYGPTADEQT